jgi:hypothetical protein
MSSITSHDNSYNDSYDQNNDQNNDNNSQNTLKKYIERIKEMIKNISSVNKLYDMIIQTIDQVSKSKFFQFNLDGNKRKLKLIICCLCFLIGITFIGLLSSFLPYIMFLVSSLKCIIWISENYDSYYTATDDHKNISNDSSTNSLGLIDIVEYYTAGMVSFILSYIITFISYFFFPFISQILIIVFGVTILAEKSYRQKCCSLVQKLLGTKQKGIDGKLDTCSSIYNLLKNIDLMIESANLIVYRMVRDSKYIYDNLDNADNIISGIQMIIKGKCTTESIESDCNKSPDNNFNNNNQSIEKNDNNGTKQVEILDDILDEIY